MRSAALLVLLLCACDKDSAPKVAPAPRDAAAASNTPTCADMARHGVELALRDPAGPPEMKAQLEATKDEAIANGTAQCEQFAPPPDVLACMVAAPTYAEYAACGDQFAPPSP